MAAITLNISKRGVTTLPTATNVVIEDTQIVMAVDNGANNTIVTVLSNGGVENWVCTSTIAQVKTNLETYAIDNPFMYILPTYKNGLPLSYPKTLVPFASINTCIGSTLTCQLTTGAQPLVAVFKGNLSPADIYDLIDTATLTANFKYLTSVTRNNNAPCAEMTVLVNAANINTITLIGSGVRNYQYSYPTHIGTIIGKEVATYRYTAPTFGVGDTLTQITTRPVGGSTTGTTTSLPIQTAPQKANVKLFVESILAAANETSGTVTVTGISTSMVITVPNSTLPFISTTLLISATPTTTAFFKS